MNVAASIPPLDSSSIKDRQQAIARLYVQTQDNLLQSTAPELPPESAYQVVDDLQGSLGTYPGPLTDDAFTKWAEEIIQYRTSVLKGIHYILSSECGELGLDRETRAQAVHDIESATWAKVFSDAQRWMKPGTASFPTRLTAKAKWQAIAWKTTRLRERARQATLGAADVEYGLQAGRQIHFPGTDPKVPLITQRRLAVYQWLRAQLANGPRNPKELKEAAHAAGFGKDLLQAARRRYQVAAKRCGRSQMWELPIIPE